MVRLSGLRTGRLYHKGIFLVLVSVTCNWGSACTVLINALCDRGVKGTDLSGTWTFQATNVVYFNTTFSGAFVKLRNATISFVMCVCPHGTTRLPLERVCLKFNIWVFFENLSRKFKFHYNRTKITGTLHEDQYIFLIISRRILLRKRNVSDKRCRENQNTHFMFCTSFSKIVPFVM